MKGSLGLLEVDALLLVVTYGGGRRVGEGVAKVGGAAQRDPGLVPRPGETGLEKEMSQFLKFRNREYELIKLNQLSGKRIFDLGYMLSFLVGTTCISYAGQQ